MQHGYTDTDLIRFIYDEMPPAEKAAMATALASDPELNDRLEQFRSTLGALEEVHMEPEKSTIDLILGYSRNEPVQPAGSLEPSH